MVVEVVVIVVLGVVAQVLHRPEDIESGPAEVHVVKGVYRFAGEMQQQLG